MHLGMKKNTFYTHNGLVPSAWVYVVISCLGRF